MIEVKSLPQKGRCVVTTQKITPGTIVEIAPVSACNSEERVLFQKTDFFKYLFVRPGEYSIGDNIKGYVVFGLASFCSHHKNPNAYIDWIEDEVGIWSHLVAKQEMQKGEEVTLFYTNINEYYDAKSYV